MTRRRAYFALSICKQCLNALFDVYPSQTSIDSRVEQAPWRSANQHLRNTWRYLPRLDIMREEIFVSSTPYCTLWQMWKRLPSFSRCRSHKKNLKICKQL